MGKSPAMKSFSPGDQPGRCQDPQVEHIVTNSLVEAEVTPPHSSVTPVKSESAQAPAHSGTSQLPDGPGSPVALSPSSSVAPSQDCSVECLEVLARRLSFGSSTSGTSSHAEPTENTAVSSSDEPVLSERVQELLLGVSALYAVCIEGESDPA